MELDELLYSILEIIGVAEWILSKDDGDGEGDELETQSLIASRDDDKVIASGEDGTVEGTKPTLQNLLNEGIEPQTNQITTLHK